MDQYIGEIKIVSQSFAPRGWALCNGQLLAIAQNQALFSILGTTYGGNGVTTFALPNLQGRTPLGFSGTYPLGAVVGSPTNTLLLSQLPAHNHLLQANSAAGNTNAPLNNYFADTGIGDDEYTNLSPNTVMSPSVLSSVGSNLPVPTMQPYLGITFIVALTGIFPSRN